MDFSADIFKVLPHYALSLFCDLPRNETEIGKAIERRRSFQKGSFSYNKFGLRVQGENVGLSC